MMVMEVRCYDGDRDAVMEVRCGAMMMMKELRSVL